MLEDKARELGRLVGQSPEYLALKRANDALQGDRDAMALLRKMEELRLSAQEMIEAGEQPTEQMEQDLDQLLGRVQVSALYQGAVSAQENFDKVMLRVNDWIFDGIKKGSASPIITLG